MKKKLTSRIKRIFPTQLLIDFNEIMYTDVTNEERGKLVKQRLRDYGIDFFPLGSGTNRLGIQIEDAVYKIALDRHGTIDNRREFKYTDRLQPYVIKVYETTVDGLVASCEPYTIISAEEFTESEAEIRQILKEISKHFFIGDIGFNLKNYVNWGRSKVTGKIGILDFAYVYTVSYNVFRCDCPSRPFLAFDSNYDKLICPECGKSWTFGEVRKRISKKNEADEIGDMRSLSYNLHLPVEVLDENKNYTISLYNTAEQQERYNKKRMEKIRNREIIEKMEQREQQSFNEFEPDEATSFEELMKLINERYPVEE